MDTEQQERFAQAVERKQAEAAARSRAPQPETPGDGPVTTAEQASRISASGAQDERSVRDKNSGRGKKTADAWNQ